MSKRSGTRKPKEDCNQPAFRIVTQLTRETESADKSNISAALDNAEVRKEIMREMGRRGGQKGGKARAASLSPRKRAEIAALAAAARWKKS